MQHEEIIRKLICQVVASALARAEATHAKAELLDRSISFCWQSPKHRAMFPPMQGALIMAINAI